MCGIAGVVPLRAEAAPVSPELLEAMCATLTHRGPDEQSVDVVQGVGLGMRRLSIIDLAGGSQPLYNEDHTVRAIHNGEIYNYRELRSELQRAGHRFRSRTDGEVLVHLWEDEGAALASSLNGMFACAILDCAKRRLAVIRDRIGIKPLFYALTDEYLVFASEVKAVLASGLVDRELDLEALGEFLAWEYVPAPRTLLRDVRKLEAGSMLLVDLDHGSIEHRQWWRLPEPEPGARHSPGEWEELVDAKVRTCVQRRLISDVPLGALLSGGVDSSLVAAAMDGGDGDRPRAFSVGFEARGYDELEWAGRVARHLGLDHEVEILEPRAAELFDPLMQFMDDPIADFSIFPTYLVSRMARRHVTVALSGDGGDELFGGYESYVAQEMARLWMRVPTLLRASAVEPTVRRLRPTGAKKGLINKAIRFVEGLGHDPALEHARWRLFAGDTLRRALFTDESFEQVGKSEEHVLRLLDEANGRHDLERRLYADLRSYLVDNCLVKIDRMSMACSLEVRVPLLDHELVELAFTVPSELKVRGRETKILLKRVAARHVPRECVYRPKEGFSMPVKEWLRGELRDRMEELLSPKRLRREGLFRPATVERLMAEHQARRANHSHVLWALMVFQDWRGRWLER